MEGHHQRISHRKFSLNFSSVSNPFFFFLLFTFCFVNDIALAIFSFDSLVGEKNVEINLVIYFFMFVRRKTFLISKRNVLFVYEHSCNFNHNDQKIFYLSFRWWQFVTNKKHCVRTLVGVCVFVCFRFNSFRLVYGFFF